MHISCDTLFVKLLVAIGHCCFGHCVSVCRSVGQFGCDQADVAVLTDVLVVRQRTPSATVTSPSGHRCLPCCVYIKFILVLYETFPLDQQ